MVYMVFSALTVAGSDSGGGAGLQADLKTFAAHRVHGTCVVTSLTAQNTFEVCGVSDVPLEFIEAQFDAVHTDFNVGAAKTGMLSSREIIEAVAKKLGSYPVVVDPVMVSESGGRLLAEDAIETLKSVLLPKAILVTPNLFEAEILGGMKIHDQEDMREACKIISGLGCDVVVKGGHLNATDLLYADGRFYTFPERKLEGGFHGSGCTFAAAITSNTALGFDLVSSVSNTKAFIMGALEAAYSPGMGDVKVVNQMRVPFEENYDEGMLAVRRTVGELEVLDGLFGITPEVGMNICYAREGAESVGDVVALSGRLFRVGERVRAVGDVRYGGSRHMARVVLAAMSSDSGMRSAVNIKYRPETIEAVKMRCDFSISSFNRDDEPSKSSTMEWGTKSAINLAGRIPDIIYDEGGVGKERMIRIIGRDPADVVCKLKRILEAINGL
jgi:hydroxymethylpyrimidine/phosphomethylpyrimidine kinase